MEAIVLVVFIVRIVVLLFVAGVLILSEVNDYD
jgi:hypothetical protein